MKASEFDRRFDAGEDVTDAVDWEKATRPNANDPKAGEQKRERIAELGRHITVLCDRHEIACYEFIKGREEEFAIPETREVFIRPIRSPISYLIALHEIGHVLGRYQLSRASAVRERWAWRWAKANALIWTAAMERYYANAIERWLRGS
ncbi:hypothetical protein [Sinorhizobium sp. M4_45]|uniref:hypothetical protein n=1 Tax=Sinorhizobium sp. M4_45 TaxID=2037901 RepID=UPI001FE1C446|nr:hypothetical protein [Sinorhizobium sp. M4_45]